MSKSDGTFAPERGVAATDCIGRPSLVVEVRDPLSSCKLGSQVEQTRQSALDRRNWGRSRPSAPPALAAEGWPCAGYSGFDNSSRFHRFLTATLIKVNPWSRMLEAKQPKSGRVDQTTAVLGTAAICDAMRIRVPR